MKRSNILEMVIVLFVLLASPLGVLSAGMEFLVQPVVTSRDFNRLAEYAHDHAGEKGGSELEPFYRYLRPDMSHKEVSLLWHKYSPGSFTGSRENDPNSKEAVDYMIMKCGESSVFLFFKDDQLYGWAKPSWVRMNGRLLKD